VRVYRALYNIDSKHKTVYKWENTDANHQMREFKFGCKAAEYNNVIIQLRSVQCKVHQL